MSAAPSGTCNECLGEVGIAARQINRAAGSLCRRWPALGPSRPSRPASEAADHNTGSGSDSTAIGPIGATARAGGDTETYKFIYGIRLFAARAVSTGVK